MLTEQKLDQSLLRTGAFVARTLLSGAAIPAGNFDLSQQLLLAQQASHTLNISAAQATPLPFNAPVTSPEGCTGWVSVTVTRFKENPTIANHERYENGDIKYQNGDILLGPARNEVFDITDRTKIIRFVTDDLGIGYTNIDGRRESKASFTRQPDIQLEQGRQGFRVLAKNTRSPQMLQYGVPCDGEQPIQFTVYDQNATPGPIAQVTPQVGGRNATPFAPEITPITIPDNIWNRLIPQGERAREININDLRRAIQEAAATTPIPTPQVQTYETLVALERAKATSTAVANVQATNEALMRRPTPTPVIVRVIERESADFWGNNLPWVLVGVFGLIAAFALAPRIGQGVPLVRTGWDNFTRHWRREDDPTPPTPTAPAAAATTTTTTTTPPATPPPSP